MSNLTKTQNGLLFQDDFSVKTLMWTLSPSDQGTQLVFGDKGLQMVHSGQYITYTITEPNLNEYSCVVELDHVPYDTTDIAGVIVLSNNKDYAECQSYMAMGPSEIGNAENYYLDVKEVIQAQLDSFVEYSVTDDTGTYPSVVPGASGSASGSTGSTSGGTSGSVFVDTLYHYIKFYKLRNKYIFYASHDGKKWIEVGNVGFDTAGTIGFFLYSVEDPVVIENSHCYFKLFTIYNSKYLTVNNVDNLYDFEIYDENNEIVVRTDNDQWKHLINRKGNKCLINTTELPVPIKNARIRIYSKTNYAVTINEYNVGDIYGGDSFEITRDIRLYIENNEINTNEIYDLGVFYRGSFYFRLNVHNHEDYIVSNVKLSVEMFSEYYSGHNEVGLSLYDEGQDETLLNYQHEVIINEIRPSEGRTVFMKLMDIPVQDFYKTANSFRFKIIIE